MLFPGPFETALPGYGLKILNVSFDGTLPGGPYSNSVLAIALRINAPATNSETTFSLRQGSKIFGGGSLKR